MRGDERPLWLKAITEVSEMLGLSARKPISFAPTGIFRDRYS
ncbi:hypothetical protein AB06_2496 [Escherichia coli 2-474-04_S1_C1]|nr:hypothetical protein AB06_2496 [Escherichia coli 2-474-04_S1_C1]